MWPADYNEAGCNNATAISWAAAITYCNGLTFAGFSDWRLPNRFELASLIIHDRYDPVLDTDYFFNITTIYTLWTSTTIFISTDLAYDISFAYGKVDYSDKSVIRRIQAVRNTR